MNTTPLSGDEIGQLGEAIYEERLRGILESDESNIGRMVVIDVETGDYEIGKTGIEPAWLLRSKRPNANLYAIRIGYKAAVALGGILERRDPR